MRFEGCQGQVHLLLQPALMDLPWGQDFQGVWPYNVRDNHVVPAFEVNVHRRTQLLRST